MAEPDFHKLSAEIINLLNKQMLEGNVPPQHIAAAAAYAAARFSTWATATTTLTAKELEDRQKFATDTFLEGFRSMLDEHFADHIRNYTQYMAPKPGTFTR